LFLKILLCDPNEILNMLAIACVMILMFLEKFNCFAISGYSEHSPSSTPLLNFGSYSNTCVPCFACCPKANFNNLKVFIPFLPIAAEFDADTVLSFLLLSAYD
jgi:hypothetical protein